MRQLESHKTALTMGIKEVLMYLNGHDYEGFVPEQSSTSTRKLSRT